MKMRVWVVSERSGASTSTWTAMVHRASNDMNMDSCDVMRCDAMRGSIDVDDSRDEDRELPGARRWYDGGARTYASETSILTNSVENRYCES